MAEQTFETFIAKERERLQKVREDALAKRAEIDDTIAATDRELAAIAAYEATKQGKTVGVKPARAPRGTTARAPKGARSELRQQILDLLASNPEGMFAEQIYKGLGATDKKGKQAIANLLVRMKADNAVYQPQKRAQYTLPAQAAGEAA